MTTLADLWREAVARDDSTPAFLVPGAGGRPPVGWAEAGRVVEELAAGFLWLGIRRGERVAILSRTRLEWTFCDWALISVGAVVVPIYPTSSALECAYVLSNSGTRFIVSEDAAQLAKVEPARSEPNALEQVIVVEGEAGGRALTLSELRERGRVLLAGSPRVVDEARAGIAEEDVLTIVYTSGTTGPPKGCVLTHRNYRAMVEMVEAVEGLIEPGDVTLLHLPLAHTFARLVQFLAAATGLTVAHCPDVAALPSALREVRPTVFASVPRLYERFAAAVRAGVEEQRGPRRRLVGWALDAGYARSACRQARRRLGPSAALRVALADRLVLRRARDRFGGRLRTAISGGAPLPQEVAEFLDALGILVLEGYGLTECTTVATLNRPRCYRLGSVGPPLPGVELRIEEDGEVLIRGENVFAGYYRDDEATSAVLTDAGWLRSGDIGRLDADGFLTISERKKDVIVTAGGDNVSPQNLQTALERSPLISQALVVGDGRPHLVALLSLDEEAVARLARGEEPARAAVEQVVAHVNSERGRVEQIKRFAIVPRAFSEQAGELTPTLKLRRRVCEEHYRDEIERLYAGH